MPLILNVFLSIKFNVSFLDHETASMVFFLSEYEFKLDEKHRCVAELVCVDILTHNATSPPN